jgi:uncharacterized membrane protein YhfC
LHHRILDAGFSVTRAVLSLYAIKVIFGLVAYYLQDLGWSVLGVGSAVFIVFTLILAYLYKRQRELAKLDEKL